MRTALLRKDARVGYEDIPLYETRNGERLRAYAPVTIVFSDGTSRIVAVVEISEKGGRLCGYDLSAELGEPASLILGDVGPIVGKVAWRRGDFLGVHFLGRLHRHTLAYFQNYVRDTIEELTRSTGTSEPRTNTLLRVAEP